MPQPDTGGVFAQHPVDRVRVHPAGRVMRPGIAAQRPEQRPAMIAPMARQLQLSADARRRLRVDGERIAPAALASEAQRVQTSVLVQVAHGQRRNLRAA